MHRLFTYVAVVLLSVGSISAQEKLSPLFDMLATNSRINRPSEFRQLQSSIIERYKDLTPGLRADLLTELSQQMRDKVVNELRSIRLLKNGNTLEVHRGAALVGAMPIGSNAAATVLDKTRNHAAAALSALMAEATAGLDQSVSDGLSYGLLGGMAELGIRSERVDSKDVKQSDKLRTALANAIVDLAVRELQARLPVRDQTDPARTLGVIDTIVSAFNAGTQRLGDNVVAMFDRAEHIIDKMTSELNEWLVSGNSGLAITREKGDVGGGIHLSYNLGNWLQAGLYVNSQIDPPDSAQPGPFFGGFQLRATMADTELNGFLSMYYGAADTSRIDGATIEMGVGAAQNVGPLIVGAAVLYQHQKLLTDSLGTTSTIGKINAGLQFRVPDRSAPVFTIGWGWDLERGFDSGGPIIQVGVPLVAED